MKIMYRNKKLERVCICAEAAERKYGIRMAEMIRLRINQLSSADTVEWLIQNHIGRCHPLVQNRKGQYAMDLDHPYRLIFEKDNDDIRVVRIMEIVDYH